MRERYGFGPAEVTPMLANGVKVSARTDVIRVPTRTELPCSARAVSTIIGAMRRNRKFRPRGDTATRTDANHSKLASP